MSGRRRRRRKQRSQSRPGGGEMRSSQDQEKKLPNTHRHESSLDSLSRDRRERRRRPSKKDVIVDSLLFHYEGPTNEKGQRHGFGLNIQNDGSRYEGQYVNDQRHGWGRWCSESVNYVGQWDRDQLTGEGTMTRTGVVREEGIFCNGRLLSGRQVFLDRRTGADGDIVEATNFDKEGMVHDCYATKYFRSSNDRYEGFFKHGQRHGYGTYYFGANDPDQSCDDGFNQEDSARMENSMHPSCVEERWEGYWREGVRHGYGLVIQNHHASHGTPPVGAGDEADSTTVLSVNYIDGKAQGWGSQVMDNGDTYDGMFENDKRHGYGHYEWAPLNNHVVRTTIDATTRDHYLGEWQNNMMHGMGRKVTGELVYEGEWRDGMAHGVGTTWYGSTGHVHSGEYEFDLPHGYGRYDYRSESDDSDSDDVSSPDRRSPLVGYWVHGEFRSESLKELQQQGFFPTLVA